MCVAGLFRNEPEAVTEIAGNVTENVSVSVGSVRKAWVKNLVINSLVTILISF